jgi:serine/threonine protein kinase
MLPDTAADEMIIQPILLAVDPKQRYFLGPVTTCIPEYEIPENTIPAECDIAGQNRGIPINIRTKDPRIVLFENGGRDLSNILHGGAPLTKADGVSLLVGLANLLEGLVHLHAANTAHLDIKLPNIVASVRPDSSYNVRFIDFGLTLSSEMLKSKTPDELKHLTSDYYAWPYELRNVYYKRTGGTARGLTDFYGSLVLNYLSPQVPTWMWYSGSAPILGTREGEEMLQRARAANPVVLIKAADIYSMGRVLAEIFNYVTGQECVGPDRFNNTRGGVPDTVSIPFWRLIVRMLNPDMFLRPSAAEVFAEYSALLPLISQMHTYTTVSVAPSVGNNTNNNNTSWSFCDPGTWKCFRRARTLRKSKVI